MSAAAFLISSNDVMAAAEAEVTINAANGLDGKEITEPVSWTILKLDKNGKPGNTPAVQEAAAVLKTKLKPGQYQVLGQTKGMAAKQTFTVGKEPVVRTVTFGMAEISIKMITSKGRKPVKEPIQWDMLTYVKGQPKGGQLVHTVKAPTATFNVPAGGYVVRATYNGTTADLVVPLKAGQSYEYTLNLYAGFAEAAAYNGKKKVVNDVTWQVVRAKANEKGEHELVAEHTGPEPKIMLREGKYLVIARYGETWGKEHLNVMAGELSKVKITLGKDVGMPVVASN
ncbi:hypothetical protein [Dongia deserti]|uniref:hypothetical protein n=1 Tax=Dongia deserti TaxID=2268030 RepID=UPI000E6506B4|nr:hypothetical protein [Dongia deserti]